MSTQQRHPSILQCGTGRVASAVNQQEAVRKRVKATLLRRSEDNSKERLAKNRRVDVGKAAIAARLFFKQHALFWLLLLSHLVTVNVLDEIAEQCEQATCVR